MTGPGQSARALARSRKGLLRPALYAVREMTPPLRSTNVFPPREMLVFYPRPPVPR